MAMNKQRRTANLNNIVTYDTLKNVTLLADLTIEGLTGAGFVKADANGLLSVDTGAYLPIPSQSGNSGKYLTTDGSNLSWGTVSTSNIYTADGTLTGNRTVTLDSKQLSFKDSSANLTNYTYSVGVPTGVSAPSWPSSIIYEGQYLISSLSSAEPFNTRVWGRNQSASNKSFYVNQLFADITAESTGANQILNQTFYTQRGSQLDTSTAATGFMRGIASFLGHNYLGGQATTVQINTTNQYNFQAGISNYVGNVTTAITYFSQLIQGNSNNSQANTLTNYYAFRADAGIGSASGGSSVVTNYYGLYLNTPTVGTTGTITNRWGIYAPDSAMSHYFNGNVVLGSTTLAGYKLDVNGTGRFTGDVLVSNYLLATKTSTYSSGAPVQSIAAISDVTLASGASISSGTFIGSLISNGINTFNGSITIPNSVIMSSQTLIQRLKFNSAGMTATLTQGGVGIRAAAAQIQQIQFPDDSTTGTISHVAGLQLLAPYKNTGNQVTVTNYYGIAINPSDEYSTQVAVTNRWGIYQVGASDNNYFAGKVLIGTNTVGTSALDVNGTARITGITTLGPVSGNFLQTQASTATWFSDGNNPLRIVRTFNLFNLDNNGSLTILSHFTSQKIFSSLNQDSGGTGIYTASITAVVSGVNRNMTNQNRQVLQLTSTGAGSVINAPKLSFLDISRGDATGFTSYVGIDVIDCEVRLNSTSGSTIVGGSSINASAKLQVDSSTSGFLPPRMTGAQAEAIGTPAEGLLVYANNGNGTTITTTGWWGYNGTTWVKLN